MVLFDKRRFESVRIYKFSEGICVQIKKLGSLVSMGQGRLSFSSISAFLEIFGFFALTNQNP